MRPTVERMRPEDMGLLIVVTWVAPARPLPPGCSAKTARQTGEAVGKSAARSSVVLGGLV